MLQSGEFSVISPCLSQCNSSSNTLSQRERLWCLTTFEPSLSLHLPFPLRPQESPSGFSSASLTRIQIWSRENKRLWILRRDRRESQWDSLGNLLLLLIHFLGFLTGPGRLGSVCWQSALISHWLKNRLRPECNTMAAAVRVDESQTWRGGWVLLFCHFWTPVT